MIYLRQMKCKMNAPTEHAFSVMCYYTAHTYVFITGESHSEGEGISQQFMRTIMSVKWNENTESDAAALAVLWAQDFYRVQ